MILPLYFVYLNLLPSFSKSIQNQHPSCGNYLICLHFHAASSFPEGNMNKLCPVTAFLFASPRVGDSNFGNMVLEMNSLHLLRVTNALDAIPHVPTIPFIHVGEELMIDTQKSNYLKKFTNLLGAHNLEGYLHGVAGTQGTAGGFKLEVKRPIELVNKKLGIVKNEYSVPVAWWVMKNKGMTQLKDGSWKLDDHEKDDVEP